MEKSLLIQNEITETTENVLNSETVCADEPKVEKKEMVLKNDVKMPPRVKIRQELKKVSTFTEEEISIMWWSSLYKAYSLIVRYEQQGVEDEFRKEEWFQQAMKEKGTAKNSAVKAVSGSVDKYLAEKSAKSFDYSGYAAQAKSEALPNEEKVMLKQKQRESKKILKEMKAVDKAQAKELKKNFKFQKRKFKSGEITLDKFFEFINTILGLNSNALQPAAVLANS